MYSCFFSIGTGIISELVQNADDARATTVQIMLDKNSYSTNSLLSPNMAAWQGPALCVHNDAMFTPEDFRYFFIYYHCDKYL